jgi:hypothetical protein
LDENQFFAIKTTSMQPTPHRLKMLNSDWARQVVGKRKRSGKPTIYFDNKGARFNVYATQMMQIEKTDLLSIAYDESYPADLYVVKGPGGFAPHMYESGESQISKSPLLQVVQNAMGQPNQEYFKFEIYNEPITVNGIECWVVNTRRPLLKKVYKNSKQPEYAA